MKIAVITTDSCPWCDKVKALLDDKGLIYDTYDISDHVWSTVRRFFATAGFRTVPQVFIDGKLIGGYDATKEFLDGQV